jgi:TolA-binding protein
MKHLTQMYQLSIALLLATVFFACSSTTEKTPEDNFFDPIDKIIRKKSGTGSLPQVVTRDRYAPSTSDDSKEEIMVLLLDQNKQLNDVIQQLNSLTKREIADSLKSMDTLSDLFAVRDRISNEMLLEMIREQNQRLNDVIEQLKLLSQNQYRASPNFTDALAEPSSASRLSSPKQYQVSLGYGKAIQLYQQRKYKQAIQSFDSLLNKGVNAELQDNCHFWMGVCYFHLKKINQAMDEFKDVLNIVGADKTEGAYFMIGQCYEQMGSLKDAKIAFEKMLRKYPVGNLRQIAEVKLALLK